MSTFLSDDIRASLMAAQKAMLKNASRLRVLAGNAVYPVIHQWDGGFSVLSEDAPKLRGFVDPYDGTRHLAQCLIVASEEEGAEITYEYKRATAALDHAPLDYSRDENAPVALLTSD